MKQSFGHKLKFVRIKLGLTQSQLAERLCTSPSTIGMYEQGRREPDYDTLLNICKTLNVSVYDLFPENDIFRADIFLRYLLTCLEKSEKPVVWHGKLLDKKQKHDIAYVLKLLLEHG